MTALRLAWRLQAWSIGTLVGVALLLAALALVLPATSVGSGDPRMIVLFLTLALPVLLGSVLGVGIVGGELESGTARLAWPLAISRWRWLWLRSWPIALVGVLATAPLGLSAGRLMDETSASDIFHYAMRGPVVALHLLTTFGIALVIASIVRRVVPALILSVVASTFLFIFVTVLIQPWLAEQATLIPIEGADRQSIIAVLGYEHAALDSSGELAITEPECSSPADCRAAFADLIPAAVGVPQDAFWPLVELEATLTLFVTSVAAVLVVGVTSRWGPR